MKKPTLWILGLILLASCASKVGTENSPISFRKDGGIHFNIDDKTVTANHLYDGGKAFREGKPDIHVRKKETLHTQFTISEREVKLNDFVIIILPEGEVRGRISHLMPHGRFILDAEIPVRPGFSGAPIVLEKTRKVIGLVIGFSEVKPFRVYVYGLGQSLRKEQLRIIKKV